MSDDYTPDEKELRDAWLEWRHDADDNEPQHTDEFYRFIAKVKADALREAAEAWQVETQGTQPGPSNFMTRRADRIERDER